MAKSNDSRINLGRKPADRSEAWWALTPQAKRRLMELRGQGHVEMGATGERAPYWWSQEYGNAMAKIEAKQFVRNALRAWRMQLNLTIERYYKG